MRGAVRGGVGGERGDASGEADAGEEGEGEGGEETEEGEGEEKEAGRCGWVVDEVVGCDAGVGDGGG